MTQDFQKPKYETPTMFDLGSMVKGSGICDTGSAPSSELLDCTAGPTASRDCTAGTAALNNCSQGVSAIPACTAGDSATGACTAGGQVT
jgi:hypothetical protein